MRSVLWVLAALLSGVSGRAQEPVAQLHVGTAAGATTFHIGERVSLQLDFTAPPDAHLAVTTASYDRSGRMNYESFEVSPAAGFSDPLETYFNGNAFMMGGLTSVAALSQSPYSMRLNMNEWVRFDSPGDYTVVVHSSRVFKANRPFFSDLQHPVTSNSIKLHIIAATPEWQKATLGRAVKALAAMSTPYAPPSDETNAAVADIRFLGSVDSIAVMADGLRDDQTAQASPFELGLIGLPPSLHDLAGRTLRGRIDDPAVPVTGSLLMALSEQERISAATPEESFREAGAAHEAAVQLAIAALPRKTGKAKAATASLLLTNGGNLTDSDKAAIAQAISSSFSELPEDKQAILLQWDWDALRPAISRDTLEHLASLPIEDAGSNSMTTYERMQLKSSALSRWYELDPVAATRAAYAQIGSERPSLTAARLWFLPTEPLPQFEAIWAQSLVSPPEHGGNPEVLAALMTRFGTGAFASQIAAKVRESLDHQACAPQAAMLAYVVKFNAELARPLLQEALAARSDTACYRNLFNDVAQYTISPVLTDVAIETVADSDTQTARTAIGYLTLYGDERAQAPILNRYRSWTQEWEGRGDELEGNFVKPATNREQLQLGESLGWALLVNQGWITDDRLRAEVLQRCVGEQMCRTLQQQIKMTGLAPYSVTLYQHEERQFIHIGPYEIPNLDLLKAKLSQYPRGTAFRLLPSTPPVDKRFEAEVRTVFEDAGMTVSGGS